VGSYGFNRFGMHDVHGNVWELCRGSRVSYTQPTSGWDGMRGAEGVEIGFRGGCWNLGATMVRSAGRADGARSMKGPQIGLRAVRRLASSTP
jgi:formylglycine-generating enzyme required for sulfatase activity